MQRAPIVFPVRVAAGAHVVQTTTREVSLDGVFVCSLRPPQPGTRITLKLYVPGAAYAEEAEAIVREWRSADRLFRQAAARTNDRHVTPYAYTRSGVSV